MPAPCPVPSPVIAPRIAFPSPATSHGSSRFSVASVRNGEPPGGHGHGAGVAGACMGSADLLSGNPAARASQQPPVTRELFEQLVRDFDIRLAGLSTSALTDQRNTLREGTQVGNGSRQPTEVERQCLIVGLTLELLQHPGVWNEGAGDLVPLIVHSAHWPPDIALRIVDADDGAIHLHRHGQPELSHRRPGDQELPEVQDNEIILLRHGRHFDLLRRDRDRVIDEVTADGDCFFSCISKALGHDDIEASNLRLRQGLAEHLWSQPEALQAVAAFDGPLHDPGPNQVKRTADRVEEKGVLIPPPDYEGSDGVSASKVPGSVSASLMPAMIGFYNAEMRRFMRDDVYPPPLLARMHEKLVKDLVNEVVEMLEASDNGSLRQELVTAFETDFEAHKATNAHELTRVQGLIAKALEKVRNEYTEQIEGVLTENSHGLDETALERMNLDIRQRVVTQLQASLKAIRSNEPPQDHVKSIEAHMDGYFAAVKLANAEKRATSKSASSSASKSASKSAD